MLGKDLFIIAELSANHNHSLDVALRTIRAMAASGADAVKIQTYRPESLVMDIDNEYFGKIKTGPWAGIKRYDLYKQAATPYEWHDTLQKEANECGLTFFSSPFDIEGVEFLETLNTPIYKVASFEINDIPLIRRMAQTGKPIIMSTGLADIEDIELAIKTCKDEGNNQITLLKCTSQYPATFEQANMLMIPDMIQRFGTEVGVSDHSMGSVVPMTAVALGATVIEKHFILSRDMGGADAAFSMEPAEFKQMAEDVKNVRKAMGCVDYFVSSEQKERRRALYALEEIKAGDVFSDKNVRSFRPGFGLHPKYYDVIIGKTSKRHISKGDILTEEDL